MDLVDWFSTGILQTQSPGDRARATVSLQRGHILKRRPYSIPFTYSISVDGHAAWIGYLDFDQLYVSNPYCGPQLLARFCVELRCLAEGKSPSEHPGSDRATWSAVFAACYSPGDIYCCEPPEDMESKRDEFTRKSFAEMVHVDPAEFYAYEIQTVSGANGRGSTMRSEFRLVSRPGASHRWMFWTHAPGRISHDTAELSYWFKRHVAQLRGDRRPQWDSGQRDRWLEHIHYELTGSSISESKLNALAAIPEEKPNLSLILGGEDAVGKVRRWVIPRAVVGQAKWSGANLKLEFVDTDDSQSKRVELLFRSIEAAREAIGEVLTGERRRLGIGPQLRGIVAAPKDDQFLVMVGLTEEEEGVQSAAFIERHGKGTYQFRSGLLFQILAPYQSAPSDAPG